MTATTLNFEADLEHYAQVFANLTPDTLHSLPDLFAPEVRFKDPFNEVVGRKQIIAIFEHMFATLDQPHFVIEHSAVKGPVGYIHWHFHFTLKGKNQPQTLEGLSRIVFNKQGQVLEHTDFWDAGEAVYAQVPLLGWGVRWVAKKLSASR